MNPNGPVPPFFWFSCPLLFQCETLANQSQIITHNCHFSILQFFELAVSQICVHFLLFSLCYGSHSQFGFSVAVIKQGFPTFKQQSCVLQDCAT